MTSSTGLQWIKWMDKKLVYFLSNYHDPSETTIVNRKQKDGSLLAVNCPVVASDYNKHMGYVDYSDRLVATYKIDRKSKRWWLRLFWYFVDVTVVNSFIIFKNENSQSTLTLKEFRLQLVEKLVAQAKPAPRGRKRKQRTVNAHKPKVSLTKRQSESAHMPENLGDFRRCANCSTREKPKRTAWVCSTCDVPLCLSSSQNCFLEYHK
ncbi:piggyBac transposable element-derived protein 4-like [Leptopilina boulardi]|uniref:piggyBac transposable element-derived protein 4-like n=1 Tax=Leptopilina boulardi TaxID=63433 RepID=UPI0021F67C00|nr:piggyBac transposable element-derived protein 4-like [Leptopilina boulardi]XP_051167639.1 piggyBac transposable element-derived protein 4-like [Leptopilina boulardi]